ncbi:hypothetical protein QFC21_000853 [Naganishia friedmannii]|uniref:Uncharacterized protein n=1 Tax=Naganishia friedmannii TaxID=89922 RepID=A0ACC2W7L6_9TREE|nr:hypothetical protein QFC21_000853 [Naganishia friedmannii]
MATSTSAFLSPIPPSSSQSTSPSNSLSHSSHSSHQTQNQTSYFPDSSIETPLLRASSPSEGSIQLPTSRQQRRQAGDWRAYLASIKAWFAANQGLVLIACSQGFFASMNASVKFLQGEEQGGGLPTLQLVAIRMAITFVGCISYLYFNNDPYWLFGPPEVRKLLALRGFIGYQSLQYLSLSDATTLGFLSPTATALLGYMILKEPFTRKEFVAGMYPSTGLPVSPEGGIGGSRTSWGNIPSHDAGLGGGRGHPTPAQRMQAVAFALMGVCGSSGAYTAIRAIGTRAKSFHSISYFSFYCVVVSIIGMLILQEPLVFPRTVIGWSLILLIGSVRMLLFSVVCVAEGMRFVSVFGLGAQLLVTMGLQREKAGRGSLAMYTQLLFATIIERILFHVQTSFLSVLGTIIILSAALWVAFSKQAKPSDLENRLDVGSALSSGMNTPIIVDGASQIPLSRSIGRVRGLSTSIGHAEQSNGIPPASRPRRSSIAKGDKRMLGDSVTVRDALLPPPGWSSSSTGPMRRNSARSPRSEHSRLDDGKYAKEEERLEHVQGEREGQS